MIRELKEILLKIAALSKADQRWILCRLPEKQKTSFKNWQGEQQLEKARRFRNLKPVPFQMPAFPQTLASYPPLYIAIVLDQGKFPWQESFLPEIDREGRIKALLSGQVQEIKEEARQALFKLWETDANLKQPRLSKEGIVGLELNHD